MRRHAVHLAFSESFSLNVISSFEGNAQKALGISILSFHWCALIEFTDSRQCFDSPIMNSSLFFEPTFSGDCPLFGWLLNCLFGAMVFVMGTKCVRISDPCVSSLGEAIIAFPSHAILKAKSPVSFSL